MADLGVVVETPPDGSGTSRRSRLLQKAKGYFGKAFDHVFMFFAENLLCTIITGVALSVALAGSVTGAYFGGYRNGQRAYCDGLTVVYESPDGLCSFDYDCERMNTTARFCAANASCIEEDPCAGVVCNQPYTCQSSLGVCDRGVCLYPPDTGAPCGTNNAGVCTASAICLEPCGPAPCMYPGMCEASPGTCSNGTCTYPASLPGTPCDGGVCDGNRACMPAPPLPELSASSATLTWKPINCTWPSVCEASPGYFNASDGSCLYPASLEGTPCQWGTCLMNGSCVVPPPPPAQGSGTNWTSIIVGIVLGITTPMILGFIFVFFKRKLRRKYLARSHSFVGGTGGMLGELKEWALIIRALVIPKYRGSPPAEEPSFPPMAENGASAELASPECKKESKKYDSAVKEDAQHSMTGTLGHPSAEEATKEGES